MCGRSHRSSRHCASEHIVYKAGHPLDFHHSPQKPSRKMRVEIKSAANFLTNLLRIKVGESLNLQQLELFCAKLEDMMITHYQKHWFPEKPFKGSGYRCIRINHKMDPIISKAGSECGFDEASLRHLFPDELTMWIDPLEVSYRIGENGSICVLFDGGSSSSKCQLSSDSWNRPPHTVTITMDNNNKMDNHHQESPETTRSLPPHQLTFERMPRSTCKESMRSSGNGGWDSYIMDPRNMNFEQLAAYVSS